MLAFGGISRTKSLYEEEQTRNSITTPYTFASHEETFEGGKKLWPEHGSMGNIKAGRSKTKTGNLDPVEGEKAARVRRGSFWHQVSVEDGPREEFGSVEKGISRKDEQINKCLCSVIFW